MARQARWGKAAIALITFEEHPQTLLGFQTQTDIAVEQAQRVVVLPDHHSAAGIPALARRHTEASFEARFQRLVDARNAKGAFALGGERTEAVKGLERGGRIGLACGLQIGRIALLQSFDQCGGTGRCAPGEVCAPLLQQRGRALGIAAIDSPRQLADTAVAGEAVAVGEQHHRIAKSRSRPLDRYVLPGNALQIGRGLAIETTSFTQLGEHRAGFDSGQLVLVAEQDQPCLRRQRSDQFGHQRQIDHRSFVHHQHVQRQRVGRIVAHLRAVAATAEQAMQGARLVRQRLLHRITDRQIGFGVADRFGHARRRFAGGGGKADGQAFATGLFQQCRQQSHHSGGFSGTGAAGDHRQAPAYRLSGGEALPVRALLIERKQARQAVAQLSVIDIRCVRRASQQLLRQLLFIRLVTGQVEPVTDQGQRRVFVWRANQRGSLKLRTPLSQRRQAKIDLRPGALTGESLER